MKITIQVEGDADEIKQLFANFPRKLLPEGQGGIHAFTAGSDGETARRKAYQDNGGRWDWRRWYRNGMPLSPAEEVEADPRPRDEQIDLAR